MVMDPQKSLEQLKKVFVKFGAVLGSKIHFGKPKFLDFNLSKTVLTGSAILT